MRILGISCDYHDSAACLVEDGVIVAAAQEERFTRKKHDARLPETAIRYCLAEADDAELDAVAFYEKPVLKLERILETAIGTAPSSIAVLARALPSFLGEKLFVEPRIADVLARAGVRGKPTFHYPEHHLSHAASAFFPSAFERAAVLTLDGVGEWATTTIGVGEGNRVEILESIDFPHSLGLLYGAFTAFCGFKVLSGEYKLMGLAPFGEPRYVQTIRDHLIDLKADGSFRLSLECFAFLDERRMTNARFEALFGGPPRAPESRITQREMDLASSVQVVLEDAVLRLARHAREVTGARALCLAGGVALNCVANAKLHRAGIFDDLFIQPAAGDAGGALGAALAVHHLVHEGARAPLARGEDRMSGALLGPEFPDDAIRAFLAERGARHRAFDDDEAWAAHVAKRIAEGAVVGLFQGRMELGPRALGNRSIVADPRSPTMQSTLNLKIKQREGFRPFAPAVLAERAGDFFELDVPSPYMLLVAQVRGASSPEPTSDREDLLARIRAVSSPIPAVTHVDGSARVQTVSREDNPRFHALLAAFERETGCPVLVNTSFNLRGEPIVGTPEDAFRTFLSTEMDVLCLGPFVLERRDQPPLSAEDRVAPELD